MSQAHGNERGALPTFFRTQTSYDSPSPTPALPLSWPQIPPPIALGAQVACDSGSAQGAGGAGGAAPVGAWAGGLLPAGARAASRRLR